jgi:hypothetical protein
MSLYVRKYRDGGMEMKKVRMRTEGKGRPGEKGTTGQGRREILKDGAKGGGGV